MGGPSSSIRSSKKGFYTSLVRSLPELEAGHKLLVTDEVVNMSACVVQLAGCMLDQATRRKILRIRVTAWSGLV